MRPLGRITAVALIGAAATGAVDARQDLLGAVAAIDPARTREALARLPGEAPRAAVAALIEAMKLAERTNVALLAEQRQVVAEIRKVQPDPHKPPKGPGAVEQLDKLHERYYALMASFDRLAAIRGAAGAAFPGLDPAEALKGLSAEIAGRGPADHRSRAAEALALLPGEGAAAALVDQLRKESDGGVAVALLEALAARKEAGREAVVAAGGRLSDALPQVVSAAARFLASTKSPDAVPLLIAALVPASGLAREAVNDALVALTGVDRHGDASAWEAWWAENGAAFRSGAWVRPAAPGDAVDGGTTTTFYGIPVKSTRVLFIVDASNSMHKPATWIPPKDGMTGSGDGPSPDLRLPEKPSKIDVAKYELKRTLGRMADGSLFNILFFNNTVWDASPGKLVTLSPETRRRTFLYIDRVGLVLGTDIYQALRSGFEYAGLAGAGMTPGPRNIDTIFFLTDGLPWVRPNVRDRGIADPERILADVKSWNERARVTINVVGIHAEGQDAEKGRSFMRRLAEQNGGIYAEPGRTP